VVGATIGIGIAVATVGGGGGGDSTSVTPAPAQSQPHQPNERADLATFVLDDRSQYGMTDVWVKWTVINHSSKPSDYVIRWEALDRKTGERVANGEEYTYNVQPGQTTKEEAPTTLDNGNARVNITSFDRTQAYN
jgi:hypothetical protein